MSGQQIPSFPFMSEANHKKFLEMLDRSAEPTPLIQALNRIADAIDRNTAALSQQMEPEPLEQEDEDKGGFTSLDQVEPGQTL
jgi:hypothetical protein